MNTKCRRRAREQRISRPTRTTDMCRWPSTDLFSRLGRIRGGLNPSDLAATLASLLGINQPSSSIGHILSQAIHPEVETLPKRTVHRRRRHGRVTSEPEATPAPAGASSPASAPSATPGKVPSSPATPSPTVPAAQPPAPAAQPPAPEAQPSAPEAQPTVPPKTPAPATSTSPQS